MDLGAKIQYDEMIVLRGGGSLVIVNRQDTPLDANALLRFRDLEACFHCCFHSLHAGE
jgi:hypothetical protein